MARQFATSIVWMPPKVLCWISDPWAVLQFQQQMDCFHGDIVNCNFHNTFNSSSMSVLDDRGVDIHELSNVCLQRRLRETSELPECFCDFFDMHKKCSVRILDPLEIIQSMVWMPSFHSWD